MVHQLSWSVFLCWLSLFGQFAALGCQAESDNGGELSIQSESTNLARQRAIDWLSQRQADDGAWRSDTYGPMRQGAAITSLVLYALCDLPAEQRERLRPNLEHANEFLQISIQSNGLVANPDGSQDHPVYSTAMYLVAAKKLQLELSRESHDELIRYLVKAQCSKQRGFAADDLNFGGWDVLGPLQTAGKTPGSNVSVTKYVIEAISDSQLPEAKAAIKRARVWLKRICDRSPDGGFYFSPHPNSDLNKSKSTVGRPLSYGSATVDGILCVRLADCSIAEDQATAMLRWLQQRESVESVPGFETEKFATGWSQSLKYYYLQSLSQLLRNDASAWAKKRKATMANHLVDLQMEDGRFENQFSRMREDDPMIATAFAIVALSNCID